MKRTFNYTRRRRIEQKNVRLLLSEDKNRAFDIEVDLSDLGLPADARVVVEAYNSSSYKRFPFGTVAMRQPPRDRDLSEFGGDVRFRIKVVEEEDGKGLLLALADKLDPGDIEEEERGGRCILPLRTSNLGPLVWSVDLQDKPKLLINKDIPGGKQWAEQDPLFQALVYPEVVRQVLNSLADDILSDVDDMDGWKRDWLDFSARFVPGEPPVEDGESGVQEWIGEVVDGFASWLGAVRKCSRVVFGGEEE